VTCTALHKEPWWNEASQAKPHQGPQCLVHHPFILFLMAKQLYGFHKIVTDFTFFLHTQAYLCRMLTDKEKAFLTRWEQERTLQKKSFYQLAIGLPVGLVFAVPILLNYFSSWYSRANMQGNAKMNPVVLIIAVLGIAVFMAIFSKKHQWDRNEQYYLELKQKSKATEPENQLSSSQTIEQ
jgi:hypothetical protein